MLVLEREPLAVEMLPTCPVHHLTIPLLSVLKTDCSRLVSSFTFFSAFSLINYKHGSLQLGRYCPSPSCSLCLELLCYLSLFSFSLLLFLLFHHHFWKKLTSLLVCFVQFFFLFPIHHPRKQLRNLDIATAARMPEHCQT